MGCKGVDSAAVVAACNARVAANPVDVDALRSLAIALSCGGKEDASLRVFERAVAVCEDCYGPRLDLAEVYLSKGRAEAAEELLLPLLRENGSAGAGGHSVDRSRRDQHCRLFKVLVEVEFELGATIKAEKASLGLIQCDPGNVEALQRLGDHYLSIEKYDRAARVFQACLEWLPDDTYFGGGLTEIHFVAVMRSTCGA